MAGYRRNRFRKKSSVTAKASTQKPTADNQQKQIVSLSKKVDTLSKDNARQWGWVNTRMNAPTGDVVLGSTTGVDAYYSACLTKPSSQVAIWDDAPVLSGIDTAYLKSMKLYWSIEQSEETDPVDYSMFVVKGHPESCAGLYQATTEMTTFTDNEHFTSNTGTVGSQKWFLHPKQFIILWQKHFTMGLRPFVSSATVLTDLHRYQQSGTISINMPGAGTKYHADEGYIFGRDELYVPRKDRIWLLIFNNNSTIDAQIAKLNWQATYSYKHTA